MIPILVAYVCLWLPSYGETRWQRASRLMAAIAPIVAGIAAGWAVWP